jgi:hypothetical protein
VHDLVCREVLLTLEQYTRDEDALLGGQYAVLLQQSLYVVATKWLFVSLIRHEH